MKKVAKMSSIARLIDNFAAHQINCLNLKHVYKKRYILMYHSQPDVSNPKGKQQLKDRKLDHSINKYLNHAFSSMIFQHNISIIRYYIATHFY
jgi:hypothetical protein